ncbi:DnaD domain protein [Mediterraneibacter catenae]|uniref:DnaD domain protein n=1 Tax=Mediterraneibacter catenae TaxID=2594882 RepID=A0A5M9I2W0_9FIRM|nr:DnaD domain protein [Mediterraneibacter catenae]KAA8502306.1 DnaD domain protein [Mediterraneibacter catenae]OUO30832.1 DNA replication protein DnaD [Lachnoclostridium sp. An298]
MKTLTLKNRFQTNATLLPNDFIDNYMIDANGEFVKVYLFLLRHLDDPCSSITISTIADCLNNTENDILRAFRYWENAGLLCVERDADGRITGLEMQKTARPGRTSVAEPAADTPQETAAPARKAPAAPRAKSKAVPIDSFRAQKEIKSLLFIAEQYLGKTLTHTEMETITYFYDTLHMSADLIEYLLESCVENGHKSMHYIQKVAFSWAEAGIETISQAKEQSALYSRNCYTVLNAFGIKNRGPAASELTYIKKWAEEYGFAPDIIEEACRRTIAATHQPSFEYADKILTKWHGRNIRHLKDVSSLDEEYQKERSSGKTAIRSRTVTKNLNNFERRNYDMDSLEEQLLNSN